MNEQMTNLFQDDQELLNLFQEMGMDAQTEAELPLEYLSMGDEEFLQNNTQFQEDLTKRYEQHFADLKEIGETYQDLTQKINKRREDVAEEMAKLHSMTERLDRIDEQLGIVKMAYDIAEGVTPQPLSVIVANVAKAKAFLQEKKEEILKGSNNFLEWVSEYLDRLEKLLFPQQGLNFSL